MRSLSRVSRVIAVLAAGATVVGMADTAAFAARKPRVQKPTLTSSVGSLTNSSTATFTFQSGTAGASFICTLDGKRGPCTSPKTYSALAQGNHVFTVVATKHGLRGSLPTSFNWTIDRTAPPAVTFSNVPTTPVTTSPDIQFSGETGDTFTCQIDVQTPVACDADTAHSTGTENVTSNGVHRLTVVPTDLAGNDGPAASVVWVVDHNGPIIVVSNPPSTTLPIPNSPVDIQFVVSGADAPTHAVQCELKRGTTVVDATADCASAGSADHYHYSAITAPTDGTYTLTITATDAAGNTTQKAVTWTYQAAAAAVPVITDGPAAYINDPAPSAATVTWTAVGVDTYSCAVDDSSPSAFASCPDPFVPDSTVSTPGAHVIYVEDTTSGGAPAEWHWTLDVAPPTLSITGGPGAHTNATSATFAISAADNDALASVTCALTVNGVAGAAGPCPVDGVFATAKSGSYSLAVTASDEAGNVTMRTRSWTVDRTRPSVGVAGLGSLVGPISVRFSEVVTGLAPGTVTLALTDTAGVVPTSRSCRSGSGAPVSCATGHFRSVRLTPKSHLVPGQHYTLAAADDAVTDLAGNGSTVFSKSFRGARTLEENTVAAVPAWQKVAATKAFGGAFVREHRAGAAASYRFRGKAVTWQTVTGPRQGKALVRVDGHRKAVVDNYAASTHYRVARVFKNLGTGKHVLTVRVLGRKGAKAGRGTFVSVDAFKVGSTVTKSPRLVQSWRRAANAKYFAGHAAVADLAGESYTLRFRGPSITWSTVTNRAQGMARVYLDGVLKSTVDNFSTTARFRVAHKLAKLADKLHTLRIVVLGKHHKGGRGNTVTIDRLTVG